MLSYVMLCIIYIVSPLNSPISVENQCGNNECGSV